MNRCALVFASCLLATGCDLFGEKGWAVAPCGTTCPTAPEATAPSTGKAWGVYKGVFVDGDRSAAFTASIPESLEQAAIACKVRYGEKNLEAAVKSFDKSRMYFEFATEQLTPGCVDPECYAMSFGFYLEATGAVKTATTGIGAILKETSTAQVKTFEGPFEGTISGSNPEQSGYCGFAIQGSTITGGCSSGLSAGDPTVFTTTLEGTTFKADSKTYFPDDVVTHYEGTVSADGLTITGTMKTALGSGTFTLDRTM